MRTCDVNDPNADPDKYSYTGHGISFDTHGSSTHIDNRIKDIVVLGRVPFQPKC